MPSRAPRACIVPGCPAVGPTSRCPAHALPARAPDFRGSAASRGYGAHWRRIRSAFLQRHPTCGACAAVGRTVTATDVDHVDGDVRNCRKANLQALCHGCHSRKTARCDGSFGRVPRRAP